MSYYINILFYLNTLFSYVVNKLKTIFQPEPDTRYIFRYNPENKLMENEIGEKLSTLKIDNEYNLSIFQGLLKYKIPYIDYSVYKIFYGFPVIANENIVVVVEDMEDEKFFEFPKGSIINYKEILELK